MVENKWLEIKVHNINKNIVISVIYRHPKGKVDLFTSHLDKTLQILSREDKLIFVCGDLNINLLNLTHEHTNHFLNTIVMENLIPHITLPTRITENSATLIDHILIKYNKNTGCEDIISGNIFCDISDHLPGFILFGKDSKSPPRPIVRIYSQDNRDKFKKYLTEIDWNPILIKIDCNLAYGKFIEIFKKGYDLCFPLRSSLKR